VTGIEPAYFAWEANVLPLNYTRLKRCGALQSVRGNEPDTENTIQPAIIFNLNYIHQAAHWNCSAIDFTRFDCNHTIDQSHD
jgi:hypothetical protein